MDAAGLSAKTTVMVFGDHGRRSHADGESIADPRVPFVVKLAGQSQGVAYPAPVDLLRVHDLTLESFPGGLDYHDSAVARRASLATRLRIRGLRGGSSADYADFADGN